MSEKFIKICPKCGSINLGLTGFNVMVEYCKDCGYGKLENKTKIQSFFPEVEIKELKEVQKEIKDGNKENN